jgi:hypothetical protein
MNKIVLVPPSSEWGVLVAASFLAGMRKVSGIKSEFFISDCPWFDEDMQNLLPGRPSCISMFEIIHGKFDNVFCLSDCLVTILQMQSCNISGLTVQEGKLTTTDAKFDSLADVYLGGQSCLFKAISNIFGGIDQCFPMFYPIFEPKMHERRGVSIKNAPLRSKVKSIFSGSDRLWHVPLRKNISKRIEESRTVSALVTDDAISAWGCASGGGRAILIKSSSMGCPNVHVDDMVEEELVRGDDLS